MSHGRTPRPHLASHNGLFPPLLDRVRSIDRYTSFTSPDDALEWLAQIYLRARTENQDVSVYLGVEKAGIVEQLRALSGELQRWRPWRFPYVFESN